MTLSLNINQSISEDLIDAFVIVNRIRFITELNKIIPKNKKIILPLHTLSEDIKHLVGSQKIMNYGCNISSGTLEAKANHCIIPFELAFAYALSVCVIGEAKRIFMVGFDGFSAHDQRQVEMLELIEQFDAMIEIPLISLTKTNYPLIKRTIYDPSI